MEVRRDGQIVVLDDVSRWVIQPGDSTKTVCWYPSQRILVKENDSEIYPYRLKNLDTSSEEEVEAQIAG